MAEEQGQVSTEQPSLDSIYKEANIDTVADDFARSAPQRQEPQQQPAQRQEPQRQAIPDPVVDTEAFKQYLQNENTNNSALRQTLARVEQHITQEQANRVRQSEEADIKQARDIVNETLKADPDMVEIALGWKARQDPKFLALWEQRKSKPEAWSKALKAVTSEFETKFQFRPDAQLVENQRAMKTAQSAMATGSKEPSREDVLGSMDLTQMNRELDKLKQRY